MTRVDASLKWVIMRFIIHAILAQQLTLLLCLSSLVSEIERHELLIEQEELNNSIHIIVFIF